MRIFIDTNILISAALNSQGTPYKAYISKSLAGAKGAGGKGGASGENKGRSGSGGNSQKFGGSSSSNRYGNTHTNSSSTASQSGSNTNTSESTQTCGNSNTVNPTHSRETQIPTGGISPSGKAAYSKTEKTSRNTQQNDGNAQTDRSSDTVPL